MGKWNSFFELHMFITCAGLMSRAIIATLFGSKMLYLAMVRKHGLAAQIFPLCSASKSRFYSHRASRASSGVKADQRYKKNFWSKGRYKTSLMACFLVVKVIMLWWLRASAHSRKSCQVAGSPKEWDYHRCSSEDPRKTLIHTSSPAFGRPYIPSALSLFRGCFSSWDLDG